MSKTNWWLILYWTPLGILSATIIVMVLFLIGALLWFNWDKPWLWCAAGFVAAWVFVIYLYDCVWPDIMTRSKDWDRARGIRRDDNGDVIGNNDIAEEKEDAS